VYKKGEEKAPYMLWNKLKVSRRVDFNSHSAEEKCPTGANGSKKTGSTATPSELYTSKERKRRRTTLDAGTAKRVTL